MSLSTVRLALLLSTCAATVGACSSYESSSSQSVTDAVPSIGGLPNYGYAGNKSYGGYSAYAGQPWGGDNGLFTGGTSNTSGGTSSGPTGGTAQVATTVAASGGASSRGTYTGGTSSSGGTISSGTSTGGASASGAGTGGRSSTAGASSTGGSRASGGSTTNGGKSNTGGMSATGGAGRTGGASAAGGTTATGGTSAPGGASATGGAVAFDWGTVTYSPTGGSSVNHQGHNTGAACLAACHSHNFQAGGTIYQTNGTTTAGNVQVGIIMGGKLSTAYSGNQGNFFMSVTGTLSWATAQIAIRTATGTAIHPATTGLSGNCNSCHNSTNRIVVP